MPVGFSASGLVLGIIVVSLVWIFTRFKRGEALRLPPGPKGLPIIGNVADMPKKEEWITFAEWGLKWGGILSVKLLGRPMIIVNSAAIMAELDKKGAIYSDRPVLEMGGELLGFSEFLPLLRYGARFRTYRKHFSRYVGSPKPIQQLYPLIEHESRRFLRRTLANPDDLMPHLRNLAGGIILRLTYGYQVQDSEDHLVNLIERANANFNTATVPGAFLVDSFPILKRLPEWFPGSNFLQIARLWAKDSVEMVDFPYNFTKQEMAAGNAFPSFVSNALENESSLSPEDIRDIKFTAGSMYGGGADTTVSAEYAFFLAMVLYPDVHEKAHAELDTVIGEGRLPGFSDQHHLPYINAIVTEVLRWNAVVPTGIPHMASEDSFIGGYYIPKGSIILANLWAMLHDPETHPDPFRFDPERHIATPGKDAQRDSRNICFGYGRRICPGMYLAEASIFACIATSLAVFNIEKAVVNGVPIVPVHESTSGIISYPKPFQCVIKPRSQRAASLITDLV